MNAIPQMNNSSKYDETRFGNELFWITLTFNVYKDLCPINKCVTKKATRRFKTIKNCTCSCMLNTTLQIIYSSEYDKVPEFGK